MHQFDPVHFDSTMYETANHAVLCCQRYLEENGGSDLAVTLQNIPPINGPAMAEIARDIITRFLQQKDLSAQVREMLGTARNCLDRALAGEAAPRSAA